MKNILRGDTTRREFIRRAALTTAGGMVALLGPESALSAAAAPQVVPRPRPLKFTGDLRDALKPRRVTNAMWDYSWLTQHYPGGAFSDFDRAADELVERGFNTVRIDAFPLVIGALKSENETITLPGEPLANWGMSDRDREHAPVRELIEFMRAMKRRGLSVILSSWGKDCKEYPGRTTALTKDRGARDYQDYAGRLVATLDTVGPMLVQEMRNKLAFARAWADEIAAPVVTTEAWGPWWHMDHPDLDWGWLRDWCEQCMTLAAEHKFWGVTPWNYSHPYWKNWSDVAWYRKVNKRFLRS